MKRKDLFPTPVWTIDNCGVSDRDKMIEFCHHVKAEDPDGRKSSNLGGWQSWDFRPEVLKQNPKMTCVVGLSTEPQRLADLRKNRMNSLKERENIKYTDLENIKKEVLNAKRTFQKYKWPLIDVTRKSVEETAASIIKIHEIYLNNAK